MNLLVPSKARLNDVFLEREEGMENVGMEGVTGRESTSHVSGRTLISKDPEIEVGEEAGEI